MVTSTSVRSIENNPNDIEHLNLVDVKEDYCFSLSDDYDVKETPNTNQDLMLNKITAKEIQEVLRVKVAIVFVLLVTICGAFAVYFHTRHSESIIFEEQFDYDANKILQSLGSSLDRSLGALDTLSRTVVTVAQISNQTFPFVTIPNYGVHVSMVLPLTGGLCVYFLPLIKFDQRRAWERYAARNNTLVEKYANESLHYQENWSHFYGPRPQNYDYQTNDVLMDAYGDIPYNISRPDRLEIFLPEWHKFPLVMDEQNMPANWDWNSVSRPDGMTRAITKKQVVVSLPYMIPVPGNDEANTENEFWCEYYKMYIPPTENCMEPMSDWVFPIFDNQNDEIEIARDNNYPDKYDVKALLVVEFRWRVLLEEILPPGSKGRIVVVSNTCGPDDFTYKIDGPNTHYLGSGDMHDSKYDRFAKHSTIHELVSNKAHGSRYAGAPIDDDSCVFSFAVYPSDEMWNQYQTNNAIIFAISAASFIILPYMLFILYSIIVTRQKQRILSTAQMSNAMITSLFPSHVLEQLYPVEIPGKNPSSGGPIAELYPETTVLFADISGFTAWSSARDPNQVFTLLEQIYGAFDKIAARRGIFKVETVGDCYVAVCGLPEARKDHGVAMVKFANDCLLAFAAVTVKLQTTLGPGTAALNIRIGINSGPTTAGVLRGSKGRFQIFGDTVNTASRMESNSVPGRIMCTQKTADLLIAAGKQHWLTRRDDLVDAKGKGFLNCYWCNLKGTDNSSVFASNPCDDTPISHRSNDGQSLVDWMAEMFEGLLTEVVCSRRVTRCSQLEYDTDVLKPRSEVSETIMLFKPGRDRCDLPKLELDAKVKLQLHSYISKVYTMYHDNPFHNFQHACHVVMASKKLLSRIVIQVGSAETSNGVKFDSLTQFAIIFSALIHDLDHPGVSNAQLIKEGCQLAEKFSNKSVAEQNSVVQSWDLLFQKEFDELRTAIMPTAADCKQFRQLLVNSVLATDLFDADLRCFRENRWEKLFNDENETNEGINRRATIIIELIIQASDVSHTMQHWHVYQHWNRKLFNEMYAAYSTGRSEKDPSDGWYEGELQFFDNYIIPLAKKLQACGAFGVSCDELLDYATDNRAEWAMKGRDIVAQFVRSVRDDVV